LELLILTQYFPPEVGAPQNRLFELAVRLRKKNVNVSVLTAMPNYPQMEIYPAYRNKKFMLEEMEGLKVYRSSIYVSRSKSIVSRMRNYFSFVISSMRAGRKIEGKFDFLLCESPPLFLAYSAMYLAKQKKAKLIFNVSDLWPESAEKLGVVRNKWLLKMAYRLEARVYKRSALVTGQTNGICSDIQSRFPFVKTYWLPNGVDLQYYDPAKILPGNWREENHFKPSDFIFIYAGILGIAQGLEIILEAASALRSESDIKFVVMGSGPEKEKLIGMKKALHLNNVIFVEPVSKSQMPVVLKNVNAAIIPLKKLDLFLGAIPSKIFESLAMEIPLLLGVDGEARDLFITRGKCGLFFEPGNSAALIKSVTQLVAHKENALELGKNGRKFVNEYFNREIIAAQFYHQLEELLIQTVKFEN
jgi:glycosyltransferase involved in cell wall biosynthesis